MSTQTHNQKGQAQPENAPTLHPGIYATGGPYTEGNCEFTMHVNECIYDESCEIALRFAVSVLKRLASGIPQSALLAKETVDGIKTYLDGQDPLRGTEGESFIKWFERDDEAIANAERGAK